MAGVRICFRDGRMELDREAMARDRMAERAGTRDVPARVRPFRDKARERDAGYQVSLPTPPTGKVYRGVDAGALMKLVMVKDPDDGSEDQEIASLPAGSYEARPGEGGSLHVYEQLAEEP